MVGSHINFPQSPANLESSHDKPALPSRHRLVWTLLDELRRAFAAGSIADRDHHHPENVHMLYRDDSHGDR